MATKTGLPETREELVQMLINRKQPQAVDSDDNCTYSHSCSGGCAIGVALKKGGAEFLESNSNLQFDELILKTPKRLSNMGLGFLGDLQMIHDVEFHWWDYKKATIGRNGLVWSNEGVFRIKELIKTYKLNIKL
tara:strand:+ start:157 stop:558 length:402 start_codon:yes stop_codon:yes gene_type:complete